MKVSYQESRTSQYQKAAVIAVQSILNARESVTDEKIELFDFALKKLPPHRALMVYGHTLMTLSNRMDEDNPYKASLANMARTITEQMGNAYADLLEEDPEFYAEQHEILAKTLFKIGQLLETITNEETVL